MLSTFNFNWHVIFVEIPLAEWVLNLPSKVVIVFVWVKCGSTNFDWKHRGCLQFIRNGSLKLWRGKFCFAWCQKWFIQSWHKRLNHVHILMPMLFFWPIQGGFFPPRLRANPLRVVECSIQLRPWVHFQVQQSERLISLWRAWLNMEWLNMFQSQ